MEYLMIIAENDSVIIHHQLDWEQIPGIQPRTCDGQNCNHNIIELNKRFKKARTIFEGLVQLWSKNPEFIEQVIFFTGNK